MDALTKAAQEHGHIEEQMAFFRESLQILKIGDAVERMTHFSSFLNTYVVQHFKYEDTTLFPPILERGEIKDIKFIQSLQSEHGRIMDLIQQFFTLLEKLHSDPETGTLSELSALVLDIINRTLQHAKLEDESLFPLVEKYASG